MNKLVDTAAQPVRLVDYRAPAWRVDNVTLDFDLGIDHTEVVSHMELRCNDAAAPLVLDGEGLELLSIALDGEPLPPGAYRQGTATLEIDGAVDGSVLDMRVRIAPAANTALEGLYLSGSRQSGFLLTQCEAQGFRHITYFFDRPDVQSCYRVTLRADRQRFPVLLAGGNPDGRGELPDGRHWARFVDPHRKPSYLFALVAGHLEHIDRDYVTADGRAVQIKIWAEADAIDRCHYALDALVRAMRWDEQTYGRNYDLDVFHVVATHDFNMGAMENKGLNVFNTKCLLADIDSTTDDEYRRVESVVAHEYFHNWSGNRVTCRDWFQLSLKEGLTVFREQSFAADMNSAPLKRIEDVSILRRTQFPEDAGPLAHPVRPAQYSEINNFYTATVYEKGAELVRMLAGQLGPEAFRRGMDNYFARNDGSAATLEDFIDALGNANGVDLRPNLAWYAHAGTPHLRCHGSYDAGARTYTLTLHQELRSAAPAPAVALPIPVKLALFAPDGSMLPLHRDGHAAAAGTEQVLLLERAEQTFVFTQVPCAPIPSLLRGFSAPVILECAASAEDLAVLVRHDPDGFNRWEASQQLATLAYEQARDGGAAPALDSWCAALAGLFTANTLDDALLAEILAPPAESELAERESQVDPQRIHALREQLQSRLADQLGAAALAQRYQALAAQERSALDGAGHGRRRLKRRVLELLSRTDPAQAWDLACSQFAAATGMSDRLAALALLVRVDLAAAAPMLAQFRSRHEHNALALDKWFTVQAQVPGQIALDRVLTLETDPAFSWKNPNRINALIGAFIRGNPSGFHRPDGAGYRLLAQRLRMLDALNPQIAARLATAFNGWHRLEPQRREQAREAIQALADRPALSPNLAEILKRVLQ
ncbi:MAG: aminopeptidase N [Rhodanobacter sp.]